MIRDLRLNLNLRCHAPGRAKARSPAPGAQDAQRVCRYRVESAHLQAIPARGCARSGLRNLTRRIIATGLAGAALYAATLGALATAQDAPPASTPDATPAATTTTAPAATPAQTSTPAAPAPTKTSTSTPAPTPSSTATAAPIPSPVQTTVSPAPTQSATATPGATPSATSTATPEATATPGQAGQGAGRSSHAGAGVHTNVQRGRTGSTRVCGKRDHSTSTSGRDCSTAPKPATSEPPTVVPAPKLSNPDGSPAPSNPTFSLATPGPARIGVPTFFIDKFRIPPFLLPIYQAAGMQYGIRWEVLAGINEIETDYGRNLNVSSAGALGWMQFMPATWKQYGVDANQDGVKDPFNPVDAIFASARYLKAAGGGTDIRRAVFAYNHANWYVDSVLLRAQVVAGLPGDLVSSLPGLTQGRFPVRAKATYAGALTKADRKRKGHNAAITVESKAGRKGIDIFAKAGSPVIAVNDGKVIKMGRTHRLGRYVVLQDVYGNTYTYAHLKNVAKTFPSPKPRKAKGDTDSKRRGAADIAKTGAE